MRVSEYTLAPFDVMVATPLAPMRDLMAGYRRVFLGLLLTTLVLSIVIGDGLSELILRPVRVIQSTANRIRSDNLNERIPVANVKDEISQLADFLDQMFDRLENSFSEIRRFAAEASHELKTPLSLVRLHTERLLVDDGLAPAQKESVLVQLEEIARVNRIIDELLFLSRAPTPARFSSSSARMRRRPFSRPSRRTLPCPPSMGAKHYIWSHRGEGVVRIDDKRIRQVLLNLLVNALNVSPKGGVATLDSILIEGLWRLSMVDEGPGLSAKQCERIFERIVRFDTGNSDQRGSGLGLPISRRIVTMRKGRIWATTRDVGRGLRVIIELPA